MRLGNLSGKYYKMLGNQKNVFWEALLITCLVFAFGVLLGIGYEGNKLDQVNEYYAQSEIALMDILILNDLVASNKTSCDVLISSNLEFADKIYEQAQTLERYEASGKITNGIKFAQKKYALLRTLLWMDLIETSKRCDDDFDSVIYLYEYESEDLARRATQQVWSKVLYDLKQDMGSRVILLPIAVDGEMTSLNSLLDNYQITTLPVVIANNEVLTELTTAEDLKAILQK